MLSPAASAQGLTALHYPALPRRIAQQGGVAPPRSTSSPPRGGLVAPRSIYAPQGGVAPSSTPSSPTSDGHHHYPGNLATARHLDAPPSPHPLGSFLCGEMPSQRVLQQRRTQGFSDMWEGIPDGLGAQGTVRGLPSFTSGNHALPPVRTSGQQDGDPTGDRPNPPFNPDPQTPHWPAKEEGWNPTPRPRPPPPQEPTPLPAEIGPEAEGGEINEGSEEKDPETPPPLPQEERQGDQPNGRAHIYSRDTEGGRPT